MCVAMSIDYLPPDKPQALTKPARAEGEKLAKKFFTSPPVNVEQIIVEHYGFTLRKLKLPDNVSGNAQLELNEIVVNVNKSNSHQRFTLAHELGHIILKHNVRKWSEFGDIHESSPDKPLEEEANAFASGLLIPSYLLKPFAVAKKSPKETAILFEVSEEAMWYAYKTYNLEKYLYKK